MKHDKKWFEGVKWAESVFKEIFFYEALEHIQDKIYCSDYGAFDRGASDYCNHVQNNISIFRYRFNDERIIS